MQSPSIDPVRLDGVMALQRISRALQAAGVQIDVKPLDINYTLTVNSNKGGVGKTTLVLMLSQVLARMGYRILLIDMDPQCNLSNGCGFMMNGKDSELYSVNDIMAQSREGFAAETIEPVRWEIPRQERPGQAPKMVQEPLSLLVDIIPGHPDLETRMMLLTEADARFRLDTALQGVRESYHVVLVDTGPRLDFLTEVAWAASDGVLGVTPLYYNEVEGIVKAYKKVLRIRRALGRPDLDFVGTAVNEYAPGRTAQQQQLEDLLEVLGADKVWVDQAIPDSEVVKKMVSNAWPMSRMPAGEPRTRVTNAVTSLAHKFLAVAGAR